MSIKLPSFLKIAVAAIVGLFKSKPQPVATDDQPADITTDEIETAIKVVNNIRTAMASPAAVLITDLIPGTIDDTIRQKLVNDLPIVAAGLTFSAELLKTTDPQTAFNAILSKVKFSDNPDQDALWHSLAARILMIVTNGRISWSNAVLAVEYCFRYLFLKAN